MFSGNKTECRCGVSCVGELFIKDGSELEMGNFKVKVNTPEESKEVQDLLVKMGYHARKNWNERNPSHESIQAWADGEFTFSLNHDQVPVGFKEITLPELRDLVVLKRNDKSDRNVVDLEYRHVNLYLDSNNNLFVFHIPTQTWIVSKLNCVRKVLARLKPIEKTISTLDTENHEQPSLNDQHAEIEQVRQTLNERQSQYGSFKDVADTTAALMDQFALGRMSNVQREALHMICSKLARIANGDPNHVDSWHGIAGYATLVVDDLES